MNDEDRQQGPLASNELQKVEAAFLRKRNQPVAQPHERIDSTTAVAAAFPSFPSFPSFPFFLLLVIFCATLRSISIPTSATAFGRRRCIEGGRNFPRREPKVSYRLEQFGQGMVVPVHELRPAEKFAEFVGFKREEAVQSHLILNRHEFGI